MENVKLIEGVKSILVSDKNGLCLFSILHSPFSVFHLNILHTARSTPNTTMSLDAFGNITNAIDTVGNSWQFTYTANNTLINEVFTSLRLCASACETNALARWVDAYSRPAGYDLAIGDTPCSRVRYGYDAEGRIATLAATNAANRGFQVTYLNEAGYNNGYTLTTPNGATFTRTVTRDPYRRSLTPDCTTRFNNVVVASFAYTFDAHSRPIARNSDRFAYNDRDEIIGATIGTNHIEHAYDTIGNHVFCAYNAATNFYANNQLNQTTASYACVPSVGSSGNAAPPLFAGYDILSTNKLTWSAQGGLQRDGRFIYAFDAEDQLVSVTSSTLSNGAIRVVNAYDYRHRRISKTVYKMQDDSPPTSPLAPPLPITHRSWHLQERHDFVYDDWNLIHETVTSFDANSTTNVTEIEYFWGPALSDILQGAGGVGGLLAVSQNGQYYFPIYDNNGNIEKYVDESGSIVVFCTYDDFGRMLTATGPLVSSFYFLFSTKYFDLEANLYNYGYRFYSPLLRRWLNRDYLEEQDAENMYLFCRNIPLIFVDVEGLFSFVSCNHCRNDEKAQIRAAMAGIHQKLGRYLERSKSGDESEDKLYHNRLSTLYSAALKQFYYSPSGTAFAQKTYFISALKVIYKNGTIEDDSDTNKRVPRIICKPRPTQEVIMAPNESVPDSVPAASDSGVIAIYNRHIGDSGIAGGWECILLHEMIHIFGNIKITPNGKDGVFIKNGVFNRQSLHWKKEATIVGLTSLLLDTECSVTGVKGCRKCGE